MGPDKSLRGNDIRSKRAGITSPMDASQGQSLTVCDFCPEMSRTSKLNVLVATLM
jgi:hypothetical protein